jgi:hypothetical protein
VSINSSVTALAVFGDVRARVCGAGPLGRSRAAAQSLADPRLRLVFTTAHQILRCFAMVCAPCCTARAPEDGHLTPHPCAAEAVDVRLDGPDIRYCAHHRDGARMHACFAPATPAAGPGPLLTLHALAHRTRVPGVHGGRDALLRHNGASGGRARARCGATPSEGALVPTQCAHVCAQDSTYAEDFATGALTRLDSRVGLPYNVTRALAGTAVLWSGTERGVVLLDERRTWVRLPER